jgi:hypothetical protein
LGSFVVPRPIDSSPSNGTGQMGLDTGQRTLGGPCH